MLLKKPNADDPLNEDVADLLLIGPGNEAKVREKMKQPIDSVLAEGLCSDPPNLARADRTKLTRLPKICLPAYFELWYYRQSQR
uniref:Ubiquitin-conjugating enzyme E2 4 n=1 Tax=Tanacetum cinerariifolium TaxID=118510 RepID=A0A6L2MHF4_TANCI|nr:ubiquitin-conjugating enzyme E2 4 [Tanacetum cinerariifolium]